MEYQIINSKTIDTWCEEGWEWGIPISHETYEAALRGEWGVYLTPTKFVPREWFGELRGKKLLGLASGGGQQMPIFSALGAKCTLLDYSARQCESDRVVAEREGYEIEILQADMTKPLPFEDESFDIIFHPVSNCYVKEVEPIFRVCFRVLKKGGIFLGGYDIGINYLFDENEEKVVFSLPFDPLSDEKIYSLFSFAQVFLRAFSILKALTSSRLSGTSSQIIAFITPLSLMMFVTSRVSMP
jgi:ubiquinone/menaquinone biosynthesis C-methylase UbiE